jgi:DNA-binding transcriptional LysR family regulator
VSLEDSATGGDAPALLQAGEIDLLVHEQGADDDSLTSVVLERDPYVLVVRADSALARRETPHRAAQLAALRPIVPSSHFSGELERNLRHVGITWSSHLRPDSAATARALVAAGLGEAIVPSSLVDQADSGTVALDLSALLPPRRIVLSRLSAREHTTAVHGFVRAVAEICALDYADEACEDAA